MNWKKTCLTIMLTGAIVPMLWAESQTGYVDGDIPSVEVMYSNHVDSAYTLSGASKNGWVFTKEFNYPSGNGWYQSGSYSVSCESMEGVTTVFVDAAACFSATISGQMYLPGDEEGSTIGWNVTGSPTGMVSSSIEPAHELLAKGTGDIVFRYLVNDGSTNNSAPGGLWRYSQDGAGGTSSDWTNSGATWSFPTDAEAGNYTIQAARNSQGALQATATATVIEVASVSAGDVISTTDNPGEDETFYVEKKEGETLSNP